MLIVVLGLAIWTYFAYYVCDDYASDFGHPTAWDAAKGRKREERSFAERRGTEATPVRHVQKYGAGPCPCHPERGDRRRSAGQHA